MFRNTALSFLLFITVNSLAQEFGGFKPTKQWSQLKKENYRIIFSPELETTAKKVAAIFSRMNQIEVNIGAKRRNLNIILQNSTTQANGYVGLAPFVSEFFLTPYPLNNAIGTLPWHYTLGVHEYQHALQFANSYRGASKVMHWIGGELFWGAAQFLSIPNWFFEGNAVLAETQYSRQGRGRIPAFFNGYRSFVLEEKIPNYDKARNGSFRDFVPNHYPLGYLMVRYGREEYGNQYWSQVLKIASSYSTIVYPFSGALKNVGEQRAPKMYKSMMQDFATHWQTSDTNLGEAIFPIGKKEVSNYYYPKFDLDGKLYFLNGSYDDATSFYTIENNEKVKIRQAGIRSNNYFDVHNGQLLFTETHFDKRWGWIDYEDIMLFNTKTKELTQLTKNGKYFHPCFSLNGENILANYVRTDGSFEIHLLSNKGKLLGKIENPKQYYISEITSTSNNTFLANARDSIGQASIVEITESGRITPLLNWTFHITGRPVEHNGKIYFEASYNGVDNLYVFEDNVVTELTTNGPGRYSPVVHPKTEELYYTEFSLNGLQLRKAEIPSGLDSFRAVPPLTSMPFYNPEFILNSEKINTEDTIQKVEIKKYRKTKSLINIHSWSPFVGQTELGVDLLSDNVLNTLDIEAGWRYNLNENKSGFNFAVNYGQYWLHVNSFLQNTNRTVRFADTTLEFNEMRTGLGVSVPLNYSSGVFSRNLRISSAYNMIATSSAFAELTEQNFHLLHHTISYRQSKLKAQKNIFPKLAFAFQLEDLRAFNESNYQLSMQNSLALPGVFKNDNIVLEADFRIENGGNNYRYIDQFFYSRGFSGYRSNETYKLSSNYHFPIAYPDKGAFGILYLLRIRGNVFFDYSLATSQYTEFNSVGFELILDTKLFRLLPVPLGIRYTHVLTQENFANSPIELFIPVSRF